MPYLVHYIRVYSWDTRLYYLQIRVRKSPPWPPFFFFNPFSPFFRILIPKESHFGSRSLGNNSRGLKTLLPIQYNWCPLSTGKTNILSFLLHRYFCYSCSLSLTWLWVQHSHRSEHCLPVPQHVSPLQRKSPGRKLGREKLGKALLGRTIQTPEPATVKWNMSRYISGQKTSQVSMIPDLQVWISEPCQQASHSLHKELKDMTVISNNCLWVWTSEP